MCWFYCAAAKGSRWGRGGGEQPFIDAKNFAGVPAPSLRRGGREAQPCSDTHIPTCTAPGSSGQLETSQGASLLRSKPTASSPNCSPRLQVSPGERPTPFINSQQDNDSKARSIPHPHSSHRSPGPIPHLQPRAGPGQDKGCPWVWLAQAGRAQGDPQPHGAAPTPLLWGLQQHQDLTQPWDLAGEAAPRAKAVTHDLKN